MKFSKKTKAAIWQEARRKVGGFGMWLEVQLRVRFDTGDYYTNRLIRFDDDSDLSDFIHWDDFCSYDFEMIGGHTLLDIPVHDKDELRDNLLVLLSDKGELIRSFTVTEACSPESYRRSEEFLSKYAEPQITPEPPKPSYRLVVTDSLHKSARYHYQVLDAAGTVISKRKSDRVYVACTADGQYYFGRRDLVGKGDHGRTVKFYTEHLAGWPEWMPEHIKKVDPAEALSRLNAIAYLEEAPASMFPILSKFDSWQEKKGGQL